MRGPPRPPTPSSPPAGVHVRYGPLVSRAGRTWERDACHPRDYITARRRRGSRSVCRGLGPRWGGPVGRRAGVGGPVSRRPASWDPRVRTPRVPLASALGSDAPSPVGPRAEVGRPMSGRPAHWGRMLSLPSPRALGSEGSDAQSPVGPRAESGATFPVGPRAGVGRPREFRSCEEAHSAGLHVGSEEDPKRQTATRT